jgi:phenylalanyl-tRNA synthetase beta chain
MFTDASFRFERGIDPEGVLRALNRAAQLIADFSGGIICKNYIDEYPRKVPAIKDITLRIDRIREVIGTSIGSKDVVRILRSIGMLVKQVEKGKYIVKPPTFRIDITREIDLIEEVIRLYGYDSVPVTMPNVTLTEMTVIPRLDLEERIRQLLNGSGYSEIVNYSFGNPSFVDHLFLSENDKRRNLVRIKNPLTEDQSVMRTTMVYGLLETWKNNVNNGSDDLKLFEIGRIFLQRKTGELPHEKNMLAGLLAGNISDDLWGSKESADFFDLKGCLENIFFDLKLKNYQYRSSNTEPFLHPGTSCAVYLDDLHIGYLGCVHPKILEKMDIKNNAYIFEINLDILVKCLRQSILCKEISKFPAVTRDVAFVISAALEAGQMLNIVLNQHEDLLENVVIFDIYQGKEIPEGKKSIGLRFSYRAVDRTLTDVEANSIHDRIIRSIVKLTDAKIRGE